MKYSELLGKRLIGFMSLEDIQKDLKEQLKTKNHDNNIFGYNTDFVLVLFLGDDILNCQRILLVSDNESGLWHWYTNWRLIELDNDISLEMDSTYKSIGEKINSIAVQSDDPNVLENDNINADMEKWIAAVGKGYWNAKEGENYFYAHIKTNTKTLSLGTVYHDCHYPDCIWEFI